MIPSIERMSDSKNFKSNCFIDFHTHSMLRGEDKKVVEIVSINLGDERVKELYTIGKHPWYIEAKLSHDEGCLLKKHLQNENCLALGEIGLDKLKGANLSTQIIAFENQLEILNEIKKPVIIHCVRTFDALFKVKKNFPSIKKWCIHGYSRHKDLARQLLNQGFNISLMPQKITDKYVELLKFLPLERFFLETDSMKGILIENVYLQVANVLRISVKDLKEQMAKNSSEFFYG